MLGLESCLQPADLRADRAAIVAASGIPPLRERTTRQPQYGNRDDCEGDDGLKRG